MLEMGALEPFVINNPENEKEKIVVLALPPELTITEMQKNWKKISFKRDYYLREYGNYKKIKKLSPKINLKRDIEIYNLKGGGKTAKEIVKIINKKYPGVIAYEEIPKIIKRLKDTAQKIITGK